MDVAEKYSIVYEQKHGKPAYIRKADLNRRTDFSDGLFTREFVIGWIEQYENRPKAEETDAYKLYEANMAAMLAELKQICTGEKSFNVDL